MAQMLRKTSIILFTLSAILFSETTERKLKYFHTRLVLLWCYKDLSGGLSTAVSLINILSLHRACLQHHVVTNVYYPVVYRPALIIINKYTCI